MMRFGRLTATILLTLGCAALAHAAKPPAAVERFDPGSIGPSPRLADPNVPTALCALGESGAPVFVANYIVPPGDTYYIRLSAELCAPCMPPDSSMLSDARLALNFPVVCSIPLNVSIVAATGPSSCRRPDPATVLCAQQQILLEPTGAGTTLFLLALPTDCLIAGDAFLRIEFPSLPDECIEIAQRPRLVTTDACATCEAYNIYPAGDDDLCAIEFPGLPIMYATVETCVVPAVQHSWGAVKVLYR
jgi:hypothetical protein